MLDAGEESRLIREHVERRVDAGDETLTLDGDFIVVEPEYCNVAMEVYKEFLLDLVREIRAIK